MATSKTNLDWKNNCIKNITFALPKLIYVLTVLLNPDNKTIKYVNHLSLIF